MDIQVLLQYQISMDLHIEQDPLFLVTRFNDNILKTSAGVADGLGESCES